MIKITLAFCPNLPDVSVMAGCAFIMRGIRVFAGAILLAIPSVPVHADMARDEIVAPSPPRQPFSLFISRFRHIALRHGISPGLYDMATRGLTPDPEVLEKAGHQPEFETPIWEYLEKRLNPVRIATGRQLVTRHARHLTAMESRYGVDRHILVAIWGLESNYGEIRGDFPVIRALATLATDGRRARYARLQLLAAFDILARGEIPLSKFTGSWAGAMGHTQFIPSTYLANAVDWDGDGKRNVWQSSLDALASTANYLRKSGWRPAMPFGWEVSLPEGFDYSHAGRMTKRPLSYWRRLKISRYDNRPFPAGTIMARLLLPAGARGPAFLVTGNFDAILAYNSATSYALAVSYLAAALKDNISIAAPWPVNDKPLSAQEKIKLQQLLTRAGFDTFGTDGRIGPRTMAAIRRYQKNAGLPQDGYASKSLLNRLAGK